MLPFWAVIAAVVGIAPSTAAEEPYTAAEEEYMREQAEKYYVPEDPLEEYIDRETGEIAWKAVPAELLEQLAGNGKASGRGGRSSSRESSARAAEATARRQEVRHNIRSFSAAASVDWGIPAVSIPAVAVPGAGDTTWEPPKLFNAPVKEAYRVLGKSTEIQIALLTDRVDLPEGVIGQLTRPICDSRGEEIFPQAAQIYGRYNYYDGAIAWKYIVLDGDAVSLDNPEEFRSVINLSERTEPGYRISVHIRNTILLTIPTK